MDSLSTSHGTYQLVRRLSAGAMGVVYEAVQPGVDRRVALKVLHPHVAAQPEALERLRREAKALSLVNHPHAVAVFELIAEPQVSAIVMEFVEGESADHRLARAGPRPFQEVATVASHVLSVLEAAHAQGVIHRDLKPANLMYDATKPDPFIRVVDFGLAQLQQRAPAAKLTAEGQAPGTPEYMAPEQVRGEEADARSDLYALACVLFELLSGAAPFESRNTVHVLTAHLYRDPPSLEDRGVRDVPRAWQAVMRRALAKPPEARFASALEMRRALEASLTAEGRERAERIVEPQRPTFVAAPADAPPVALLDEPLEQRDRDALAEALAGVGAHRANHPDEAGVVIVGGDAGLAHARKLAQATPSRPVLLFGPAEDLGLMTQAIESGVFDYLATPLEPAEVGRRIVRALERNWRPR